MLDRTPWDERVTSDGAQLQGSHPIGDGPFVTPPPDLNTMLRAWLLFGGVGSLIERMTHFTPIRLTADDAEFCGLGARNVTREGDALRFETMVGGNVVGTAELTLRDRVPVSRVQTMRTNGEEYRFEERYPTFVFDATVDAAEAFRIYE